MKDSKKIIKKPDGFIYFIAYHLVKPFLRIKCKVSYDKSGLRGLKGPALVLCPHVSNIDFLLVAVALYPVRPTFVISEHFLARPKLRWILTKMHVIPKKMFCPDIKTIMNILRAKDSGNVTVLFPEGRLPAMGHSLQITDGTADLVKRMGVDVYTVTENGAYKTFPKWGKSGFRPGRIEVTTSKLFDARSISSMTSEEIERAIALALRWGAARGVYSNEAGFGTAPTAHASATVDHPIRQAVWGVFEVTVDTLIVCTVTALLTLTTGMWTTTEYETGAIAQAAFHNAFGTFGDYFVAICVFLFVFSTIVVSAFYGWRQAEFLFGVKFSKVWRYVYPVAMVLATSGIDLTMMYMITDGFLAAIMTPNMIGLIIMVPQVAKLQKEYFNTPGKYYLADKEAKKAKKASV